jgi:MinD superfamily P-loop ATPase
MMRELVVISGKGGTGKTSLLASFAVLAGRAVLADCDVDAADLHLVLTPTVRRRETFRSGREAVIRSELCRHCGECAELCRFGAVLREAGDLQRDGSSRYRIDLTACEGCGVCVSRCPHGAIDFPERICGAWFVSDTRWGPLVNARLRPAAENSGKLVATVRQEARRLAESRGYDLVLVDGPPGIGCPVISSVTGASAVLAVSEPTVSGEHDLQRVLELCRHFSIPASACVNKWDLNPRMTERIEAKAAEGGAGVLGRIPYDRAVTAAQLQARAVVELGGPAAAAIRDIWERFKDMGA